MNISQFKFRIRTDYFGLVINYYAFFCIKKSSNLKLTVIENNTVIESRAIGDALNMMCHFYALNILPLGDVMMIAAVRVPSCQNVYMITILFPGDHCQPLLLHFPEGTLWGL